MLLHSELAERLGDLGKTPLDKVSKQLDKLILDTSQGVVPAGYAEQVWRETVWRDWEKKRKEDAERIEAEKKVEPTPKMNDFRFSTSSHVKLHGVHHALVAVVKSALNLSEVDFAVCEGVRSLDKQREYVAKGTSKTMNSKHLIQSDGYSHAVDLVPYVDGRLSWNWAHFYYLVRAMWTAGIKYNSEQDTRIGLRWGGIWDRDILDFDSSAPRLWEARVQEYCKRHKGGDFLDGPHFELCHYQPKQA